MGWLNRGRLHAGASGPERMAVGPGLMCPGLHSKGRLARVREQGKSKEVSLIKPAWNRDWLERRLPRDPRAAVRTNNRNGHNLMFPLNVAPGKDARRVPPCPGS